VAEFLVVEAEERTLEDSAEALCAMEIFGGRRKSSTVWKIELKNEDPRTIDIDLRPVEPHRFTC
jgi:hypothetical protein